MNALSRVYEQAFLEGGIPYRVVRGTAFYERKEIKDVLAFLRLAVNPRDRLSLFRVGNIPPRGLGKKGLESLAETLGKTREGDDAFLWERLEETGAGMRGKPARGSVLWHGTCGTLEAEECRGRSHPLRDGRSGIRGLLRRLNRRIGRSGRRTCSSFFP
jgi:DNA helicase-2/ATP-dependent DNA helicase PcrA